MYYVYIIKSIKYKKQIYIGLTDYLERRLKEHNIGMNISTRRYLPWKMIYYEAFSSVIDARLREKKLKDYGNSLLELKKRIKYSLNGAGFTLIEVLVAATLVALLSTMGVTGYQAVTRSGRDALRKADLQQIRSALEIYKSENNQYPTASTSCIADLSSDYINPYPHDSKSPTYNYCYVPGGDRKTYQLCAHLENGSSTTDYSTECGGANKCGASGVNCNYKVANP